MRITSFSTKDDQEVGIRSLVILVGSNNVGKSQTLRDIHDLVSSGHQDADTTIIKDAEKNFPAELGQALGDLQIDPDPNSPNHRRLKGLSTNLQGTQSKRISESDLDTDTIDEDFFERYIQPFRVAHLDASSRLDIAGSAPSHDLQEDAPSNVLRALVEGDESDRQMLSSI